MFELPPRDGGYFAKFAKRIIIGTGITGLISGGVMVWPSVSQYFQEIQQALSTGEISPAAVIPVLCCIGPAVLGFGLAYKAMRKIKNPDL